MGVEEQDMEFYGVKVILMILLIGADLGLNSSLEFDLFAALGSDMDLIMCGVHIFVEIAIFLTLFLMLCDTYLFKVGLLGVLFTHFRNVFCIHPVYIFFTILVDGSRIRYLLEREHHQWDLYRNMSFQSISIIHKLAAALYYMANIRAIIKLTDPIFYQKEPWILLYRQCLQSHHPAAMVMDVDRARRASTTMPYAPAGSVPIAAAAAAGGISAAGAGGGSKSSSSHLYRSSSQSRQLV